MQKQRWASQAGGDRALPIHILVVDADYEHSLPPPSAGLTPFPEHHDYGSDKGTTSAFHGMWLHPDNQTLGTGAFTIADYGGGDDAEAENAEEDSSLDVPSEEPELGSYYDVPADDEEQSLPSGQLKPPLEGWAYRGDLHSVSGTPPDTGKLLRVSRDDLQSEGAIFDHYNDEVEGTSEPESQYDNDPLDAYHGEHASGKGYKPVSREAPSGPTSPKRGHGPLTDRSASIDGLEAEPDGAVVLDAKSDPPRADESGSEVDFPLDNGVLTPDPQEFPFSELPSPSLYIGLHNEPLSKALIQNPFPTEANRNQNTKSLEHERANHAQGKRHNRVDNNGEVTSAEQRDEKPTAEDDLKADVAEPWHEEEPGPKSTPPLEEHERPPDDDFDFHHPSARMQDDQGVIPKAAQSRVVASEEPLDRNETRGAEMHMRVPQLEAGVVYPDVQQQHLHDGQVPRFPRLEARDGLPARPAPSFRQRPKGQYHPDAYSVPARPERDIHRTLDIHRSPEQRYPTARTRNGAVPYQVYAPMRMMAVRGEPLEVAVGEFSNSRGPEPSPKRQGLLARLFGWKPRRRRTEVEETGRNPYSEAHSTPPKRRGLLGLLFNPHRLSKTEDRDTDNGTYRSHQLETAPNRRDITARTLQKKHRPQPSRDGYANPDLRAPHETPTKPQGFLASVFSSFRPKRNTRPQPSNSFLSRLLAPFRRTTRQPSDIELGALDSHHHRYHHHNNKNNNPLGLGRVHISSPQFIYHRPGLPH
ncbi:21b01a1e-81b5-47c7-bdf7-0cc67f7cdcd8 [Thermothielavioides terrestris]|uniref:21b01a1e-81b5-47c7-bdf7-0cc67f7cdcd8 n=1 Tax=Thermothielavioides terrestris TaxID=2587410 RepID=A0A446BT88_9PEZI|nr:21b01a1e-81b5-47c7-bdf7-0cc67f7cdcd8 [Thermothielavioides terrestris]